MGNKDKTTRRLEEYDDVFADMINVLVFAGERVVREEDLQDIDTRSEVAADEQELRGQERDVAKLWISQNIRLALFEIENQSAPDPGMPLRIYGYNGASYKSQVIPVKKGKCKNTDWKDEDGPKDGSISANQNARIQPFIPY